MPISLDPNKTVWFPLESDKDKPDDTRPEFRCRFVTVSQRLRMSGLLDDYEKTEDPVQANAKLTEAISICLTGWRNMGMPFDLAKIDDLLTPREKLEVAYGILAHTRLAEADKRFFVSPPTSDAAPSAPDAPKPASA